MNNTDYKDFEIKPEISTQFSDTLTVYRKTYTPGQIDMCIFDQDFAMSTKEVKLLTEYLLERINE